MIIQELQISKEIKLTEKNNDIQLKTIQCIHCKRTKENKLSCIGKCVTDNEY